MTQEIRILLVDDHSLFRESLKRLLEAEAGFRVMGSCASIVEALRVLEREPADIVLLDFDLGEEQGSGFLENAAKMGFAGRVLMVTAGMSDTEIVEALDRGVSGIFVKHSRPAQLVEAIYKALSGEIWLDKRTVRSLIEGAAKKGRGPSISQALSEREQAVLVALFEGLRNKEIAVKLRVSENAVKWVLQQLFEKTGARTRSQLVRIALEKDWLTGRAED